MGTVVLVIICIIIGFGLLGFIFSKDGEREEGAIIGAAGSFLVIGNLISLITAVLIIVVLVKACS